MSRPILAALPVVTFAGRYRGSAGVAYHEHPGLELVLVTHGRCTVQVGDLRLQAQAGEAFILPAEIRHNQEDDGEVETAYAVCAVRPKDFSDAPRVVPMPLTESAAGWLRQLVDLQTHPVPPAVRGEIGRAHV